MQSPKCIFFLATSLFCLWLGQKYERSKLRQLLPSWMRWLEMRMSCEEDSMRGWCDLLTLLPHCADQEIMQLVKGALATSTSVGGVAARGMGPAPYVTSVSWALASDYHLAIAATPPPASSLDPPSSWVLYIHICIYVSSCAASININPSRTSCCFSSSLVCCSLTLCCRRFWAGKRQRA